MNNRRECRAALPLASPAWPRPASWRGFMAGAIIWVYNDFPNPSSFGRLHPPVISFTNAKGLVTQDRQRKRSWYEVQKVFRAAR